MTKPTKRRVVLLIPFWGERYVDLAEELTLPSLMASGNLPALADVFDLQVTILTKSEDAERMKGDTAIKRLGAICPVKYVEIDELLAVTNRSLYGRILTFAFVAGMKAEGAKCSNTHFILWNADFICADGSFRSLIAPIENDCDAVLSFSVRATEEQAMPLVREMIDSRNGTLPATSRQLARIALDFPHHSVVAKTVNQQDAAYRAPNQLYWRVNDDAMIARFFLMYPTCLKPRTNDPQIASFIDYSFIPDIANSANVIRIVNSDEFLALELEPAENELAMVTTGHMTVERIANYSSSWACQVHRDNFEHTIRILADDPPANLSDWEKTAAKTAGAILDSMRPAPISAVDHPFWLMSEAEHIMALQNRAGPGEIIDTIPGDILGSAQLPKIAAASEQIRAERHAKATQNNDADLSHYLPAALAQRVLKCAPNHARVYPFAAQLIGESQELWSYQTALKHDPTDIDVLIYLGKCLVRKGEISNAYILAFRAMRQAGLSVFQMRDLGELIKEVGDAKFLELFANFMEKTGAHLKEFIVNPRPNYLNDPTRLMKKR